MLHFPPDPKSYPHPYNLTWVHIIILMSRVVAHLALDNFDWIFFNKTPTCACNFTHAHGPKIGNPHPLGAARIKGTGAMGQLPLFP